MCQAMYFVPRESMRVAFAKRPCPKCGSSDLNVRFNGWDTLWVVCKCGARGKSMPSNGGNGLEPLLKDWVEGCETGKDETR